MITVKIYPNKTMHAASYNNGLIKLLCSSKQPKNYYLDLNNAAAPTKDNVTCKKCLKLLNQQKEQ